MPRARSPCVYILASGPRGTIYIGVTSDLPGRLFQHRSGITRGFVHEHRVYQLVWYEVRNAWMRQLPARSSSNAGTATGS